MLVQLLNINVVLVVLDVQITPTSCVSPIRSKKWAVRCKMRRIIVSIFDAGAPVYLMPATSRRSSHPNVVFVSTGPQPSKGAAFMHLKRTVSFISKDPKDHTLAKLPRMVSNYFVFSEIQAKYIGLPAVRSAKMTCSHIK